MNREEDAWADFATSHATHAKRYLAEDEIPSVIVQYDNDPYDLEFRFQQSIQARRMVSLLQRHVRLLDGMNSEKSDKSHTLQ